MARYIYGIDFGTTNSTLVILDITNDQVVKLFTTPFLCETVKKYFYKAIWRKKNKVGRQFS